MKIEKIVQSIQGINGYTGSAILDKNGEIVYIDENKSIDLPFLSSLFNDTFRTLNEASLDAGLSNLIRLETQTQEGLILLIYSNQVHTIFTVFELEGNISLAKMMLTQSLKKEG